MLRCLALDIGGVEGADQPQIGGLVRSHHLRIELPS